MEFDIFYSRRSISPVTTIGMFKTEANNKLDGDERVSIKLDALGGMQSMAVVNEPGLYSLIIKSNKVEAKKIRH